MFAHNVSGVIYYTTKEPVITMGKEMPFWAKHAAPAAPFRNGWVRIANWACFDILPPNPLQ